MLIELMALSLCAIGAGIWVAVRYKAPGAIGLSGVAVAMLNIVYGDNHSPLDWTILGLAIIFFFAGQLVSKEWDDYFHDGALLVNLLPWVWSLILWIIGWQLWSSMTTVPTIFAVIGIGALLYGCYRFVRYVINRVQHYRLRRSPAPDSAVPATPPHTTVTV